MFSFFSKKLEFRSYVDLDRHLFANPEDIEDKLRDAQFAKAVLNYGFERYINFLADKVLSGNAFAEKYFTQMIGTVINKIIPLSDLSPSLLDKSDPRLPDYLENWFLFIDKMHFVVQKKQTKNLVYDYLTICSFLWAVLDRLSFGSVHEERFRETVTDVLERCVTLSDELLNESLLTKKEKDYCMNINTEAKKRLNSMKTQNILEQLMKEKRQEMEKNGSLKALRDALAKA